MTQAVLDNATLVKVGDLAPDFTLSDQNDQPATLSSFRGKNNVVLAFYPFAFSPVCTKENECFTSDWDSFQKAGAVVLAISADSSWVLKEWQKQMKFKHRLLSDQQRYVIKSYGLYLSDKNASNRATVIIDKQGKVAWVKVQPALTTQREDKEILEVLGGLK